MNMWTEHDQGEGGMTSETSTNRHRRLGSQWLHGQLEQLLPSSLTPPPSQAAAAMKVEGMTGPNPCQWHITGCYGWATRLSHFALWRSPSPCSVSLSKHARRTPADSRTVEARRPAAAWISGDSPQCRLVFGTLALSSTRRASLPWTHTDPGREGARSRGRVGPSAAATPRCAAWRSMLNHEPAGHTRSFVRRRVSQSPPPRSLEKHAANYFGWQQPAASRSASDRSPTFAAPFFFANLPRGARVVATRLAAARSSRASPKYRS